MLMCVLRRKDMVTFLSEALAKLGLLKVATVQSAVTTAESGWVTTHSGLYVRFLQPADLEQSCKFFFIIQFELYFISQTLMIVFDVPVVEFQ
jgi:hypothetical protein